MLINSFANKNVIIILYYNIHILNANQWIKKIVQFWCAHIMKAFGPGILIFDNLVKELMAGITALQSAFMRTLFSATNLALSSHYHSSDLHYHLHHQIQEVVC